MGFRQNLDAMQSKLRLTEAEIERVRARLAAYEGVDLDEDDARLLELEARLEQLEPQLRELDQLREEGAELRERLTEAEERLMAAQAARSSQPSQSDVAAAEERASMLVFLIALFSIVAIAIAFIVARALT